MTRRIGLVLALATAVMAAGAPAAYADPAVPTNYRSQVTDLDPGPTGLTIAVTGGDAFLVAVVAPGHTLAVPGYFGEPYLRFDEDGSVWRNERSPARHINVARYGVTIPPEADATAAPEWIQVGEGGRYAWHDHRTHWMSRDLPPTIAGDRAQLIFPWEFAVVFDGNEITVHGELVWFPSENPVGPILLGMLGLFPLAWWRRRRRGLLAGMTLGLAASALLVASAQHAATPVDRPLPLPLLLPVAAVVLTAISVLDRRRPIRALGASLLAAGALVIWGLFARAALTAPVLPSPLPTALERTMVAGVLVGGFAVLALLLVEARHATTPNPATAEPAVVGGPA